jgi:hypothetical protein
MTVTTTQPPVNLRAALARLAGLRQPPVQQEFWSAFTSSQTTYTLPAGWTVLRAYGISTNYRPTTDYTTSFDGFVWTVTFAVAPGAVPVCVLGERRL